MSLVIAFLRGGATAFCLTASFAVCTAFALTVLSAGAGAQEKTADTAGIDFMGHRVTPLAGVYVVTKDLNVRAEPDTNGKKVGSFQEGERVRIVGKAKGSWLAVRVDGKDLGFVYGPVLMPLIEAAFEEPLIGTVSMSGGTCAYRIVLEGESPIEGQMFNSVDYRTVLECQRSGRSYAFEMPLFITEGPYNGGTRPIHQIGMDVLELAQEYERVFSTNLLYDVEKGEVRLDSVSVKKYLDEKSAKNGKSRTVAAADVPAALAGALEIAVQGWTPAFWSDLGKALGGGSGG